MSANGTGQTYGIRKWHAGAAALVLAVLLVAGKDVLYPVRSIVWHLDALLWWLVLLAAAAGQGMIVLRWLDGDRPGMPPGMELSIAAGLGLGMLSMEVLLLGALGFMNTRALTLLVLVVFAVSIAAVRKDLALVLTHAGREIKDGAEKFPLPLAAAMARWMR